MNIERKYGNCPWSKVFHMSTLRHCNIHLIEYVLYHANNMVFIFCIKSFFPQILIMQVILTKSSDYILVNVHKLINCSPKVEIIDIWILS